MLIVLYLFLVNYQMSSVESLNILGLFPFEGRSHFFVFEKYLQKLAERGHNLTVASHFPRKETISNYHDINLGENAGEGVHPMERSYALIFNSMDYILAAGNNNCKVLLENEKVQELWKSNRHFDLVVFEDFNSDCGLGLAYKLRAPVVALTSNCLTPWHYGSFGVAFNPSYVPFHLTGGFKPTLYQRVENTLLHYTFLFKFLIAQKTDQRTVEKHLGVMPSLNELRRGIKFLLLYQNFVLTGPNLLPPNVIEVGGYHIDPPKPLPKDLQDFIEESKHGVIYVSFGTILKESTLPKHQMDAIIKTFAMLPQRVIWKWKGDAFPGDTKDIYVVKWLPQNDLLAHPKVLAFMSHCGTLSAIEAVHHGVPVVAMPVCADQPLNAEAVEMFGFGVQIALGDLTTENLLGKFRIVLDENFRNKVRNLSKAFRDRPTSAMDTAIFWSEFAAHHNLTAAHQAAHVPLYQYLCLDVAAVIGLFAALCLLVMVKVISVVVKKIWILTKIKKE